MTTNSVGDEYPQVIADDYPGWAVQHTDGQRTASCPTAATLRAAIEQTLTTDDPC